MRALGLLAALTALLLAAPVRAQEGVLVIDLERDDADAALATHLGTAMREAASQVPGWRVEAQDPSLRDAMAAASCTTLDEACLGRIALAQQAERVIWGRIIAVPPAPSAESGSDGGSPPPAVEQRLVELRVYRAGWQTIELTMNDRVPAAAASAELVMPRVRTWIERIAGRPLVGRLVIHAASQDAEVLIDGEQVLSVEDHAVVVHDVPAGRRRVEVRIPGQARMRREVTVVAGQEVVVEAELDRGRRARGDDDDDDEVDEDFRPEPAEPPGLDSLSDQRFNWLGWSLTIGGGVVLLTWVATLLRLGGIEEDSDFVAYRASVLPGDDACVEADNGESHGHSAGRVRHVQSLCSEADLLEVLQWVLLLSGSAAAGAGIFVLATDDGPPAAGVETGVQLRTTLRRDGGTLGATFRF